MLQQKGAFPFISVLVTGGHTEFVLTRGVGLHTVMGITTDDAIGTYLDRAARILKRQIPQVNDPEQIAQFVEEFNKTRDSPFCSDSSKPLQESDLEALFDPTTK